MSVVKRGKLYNAIKANCIQVYMQFYCFAKFPFEQKSIILFYEKNRLNAMQYLEYINYNPLYSLSGAYRFFGEVHRRHQLSQKIMI